MVVRILGVGAAGLVLGCGDAADPADPAAGGADPADFRPNVFLHLEPDGSLNIVCHRSEMGQGVRSTLPVLIADELGADMARVRVVQGDGDQAYGDQNTDGSSSVRTIYTAMRKVGATARVMLVQAAAARWGVPVDSCVARDHAVVHTPTDRRLDFGQLSGDAAKLPVPDDAPLRPDDQLPRVFQQLPLLDGPAYVTGTAPFGADIRLPDMLVAVIARPPVAGGTVARHDDSRALQVPGVRQVVVLPVPTQPFGFQPLGGVAVVADHTWAAIQGRKALDITWDHGPNAVYDSTSFRELLAAAVQAPGEVVRKKGDPDAALASAARVIEADYHVPHLPHLSMEPPVALASVNGDACEIWAPTQNPQAVQSSVAEALGTTPDKVTVHVTFLGGGFGRKSKADFCVEAALLSKQVQAPVRVQWTRDDDIRHDYLNTVATNRLTAGLDPQGKVVAWRHRTAFPPIATLFGGGPVPGPRELQQGVLDLGLGIDNVSAEAGAAPAHTRIGWLRAVYNLFQAFSIGSFIDELAHARNTDPLDTWLEVLGPPRQASLDELGIDALHNYGQSLDEHPVDVGRLRGVIERVTNAAGWADRSQDGRSLGLAAHRSFLSYAAAVASVVKKPDGRIAVDEVWLSFDAGTLVNPDRVHAQMEGATIFGMSLALFGEITFQDGAVQQSNFRDGARVVRMNEAPRKIHVDLVQSTAAPGGVGEPGVPPVAPAIANALFALTGQRARELPLSRTFQV